MKYKRFLCLLLAGLMMITLVQPPEVSAAYENTYINTGNYRADIIGVARTQVGYRETFDNYTKYGKWLGVNELPWCASFVSWCARQAGIPREVIRSASIADPGAYASDYSGFGVQKKDGKTYTPVPGDLFFTRELSHTGLVYHVEGEYFYTIEGNTNNDGSDNGTDVMVQKRKISNYYFGTYKNTDVKTPPVPVIATDKESYTGGQTIRISWDALPNAKSYEVVIYENSVKYLTTKVGSKNYYNFKSPKAGEYLISVSAKFEDGKSSYGQTLVNVVYVPSLHVRYNVNSGEITKPYQYLVTGGDGVDLRESPYTYAYSYGVIPAGTLLTATDIFENGSYIWAKVTYKGNTGWCLTTHNFCERVGYRAKSNGNLIQYPTGELTETIWGAGSGEKKGLLDPQSASLEKLNHAFVGWSRKSDGSGTIFRQDQTKLTLEQIDQSFAGLDKIIRMYAIWRKRVQSVSVVTLPDRTEYTVGDVLNTHGLTLQVNYADGSSEVVDSGFTVTGFDSSSAGDKTLTVSYLDAQTTFDVKVIMRLKYKIKDGYAVITDYVDGGGVAKIPEHLEGVPVTEIAANAFADCSRITAVIIPDSVTKIGKGAFSGCSRLSVVNYTGTEEQWGAITIAANNQLLTGAVIVCGYQVTGDFTLADVRVDRNDATYLLKHALNPGRFPVHVNADLNGDGRVDNEDVILLLKHTMDPAGFPLPTAMVNATILDPTGEPVVEPTEEPTVEPTGEPTEESTVEPTGEPTEEPAVEPTEEPTEEPTVEPTEEPTVEPTVEPTEAPTEEPAAEPAAEPEEASADGI